MLIRAAEQGFAETAAEVAVLLSERGLGGSDADLELRLRRWRGERGKRAEGARQLAGRWARLSGARGRDDAMIAASVALAYPDRIAKRRSASGEEWISSGGRGFRLDPTSPLARNEWLAVAEIQGAASGARILSAAPIEAGDVERLFADHIELRRTARFDPATGAVEARRERRLGAIVLAAGRDESASPAMISAALIDAVRTRGLGLLAWPDGVQGLRARAAFAAEQGGELPDLSDDTLMLTLDDWFAPLAEGKRRLSDISAGELSHALHDLLGWDGRQALDRLAPEHLQSPAGSKHPIDYAAEGGPAVEVRPQALFGLAKHPMIGGGRVPLTLRLTSPAGRPIQTTKDLPGFWSGSWASVAKEMRGRYPRHPWPDDPRGGRSHASHQESRAAFLTGIAALRHGDINGYPLGTIIMAHARIYQLAKNAMQSGRARTDQWMLEYEPTEPKRPDPLTGWAGSGDTRGQVRLTFPTLDAAQAYARREGLTAHVVAGPEKKLKIQAYADNFQVGPISF